MIEITPADEKVTSVECKPGEPTEFVLLVSNTSEDKFDIGMDMPEGTEWMTIKEEPGETRQFERTLYPVEDSAKRDKKKITIEIWPPEDTLEEGVNEAAFEFVLRVFVRPDNEEVFRSDPVPVTVERPITEKGFLKKIFGKKDNKDNNDD